MRAHRLTLAAICLAGCGGSAAEAPPAAEPAAEPAAAEATTETRPSQLERGAALYGENCASCHGADGKGTDKAPAVVGEGALPLRAAAGAKRQVAFASAGDVFRWVRVAMPGDDPGSLSDDEVAAILAFALQANGVDMSRVTLDEAAADQIELH